MEHAKDSIIRIFILLVVIGNFSCSNSKVNELRQQLQQKEQEYTRLNDDFQSAQELNDKQYGELITIQKELTKLDSLSLTLRYNVEQGRGSSYTIQEEIDVLISRIKDEIKTKNAILREQTNTEKKLRIFIETLTIQLDNKVNEINQLKADIKERDHIILVQSSKIDGLEISKSNLEKQIDNLELQKKRLSQEMQYIKGEAYYNIGVSLENAASNIPELTGIFISGAKKDEVVKTKNELRRQSRLYYKEAANLGYKKALEKL